MFITKKHLSRRTVLKGMGASFALPLLDSMVPAGTALAKTAAAPVSRLACIEMVHGAAGSSADGIVKHYWSPVKEGADFELTPTLSPLERACGYGYSCVYANTISWASPTQPLPMEMDPRVAFERLFGDGGTADERLARRRADRSILDAISESLSRLRQGLDRSDRNRLDDYF